MYILVHCAYILVHNSKANFANPFIFKWAVLVTTWYSFSYFILVYFVLFCVLVKLFRLLPKWVEILSELAFLCHCSLIKNFTPILIWFPKNISVKKYKNNLGQPSVGKKWPFPKNKEKNQDMYVTYIEPHRAFSIFKQRACR